MTTELLSWIKENPVVSAAIVAAIIGGSTKFLLDFFLTERLKKRWLIVEVKRKYSAPIVRAADDLAARIENINRNIKDGEATQWLRPLADSEISEIPFRRYFYISTLYLFVQLICWIEILKREQIYLDFTSTDETKTFNAYLDLLYATLSSRSLSDEHSDRNRRDRWIFFHNLSGIGEAMMQKNDSGTLSCITFRDFCKRYKEDHDSDTRRWLKQVESMLDSLSYDSLDIRWRRIQILWFCLDRFLRLVDPNMLRTTRDRAKSNILDSHLKQLAILEGKKLGLSLT
jgi:hypothetical protein